MTKRDVQKVRMYELMDLLEGVWAGKTFISESEERQLKSELQELIDADNREQYCRPHYPNAEEGSIWDY